MAESFDVASREESGGQTWRRRASKGCKDIRMRTTVFAMIFIMVVVMLQYRWQYWGWWMMMTVLKTFHWWGWLGYWGHQAFHLAFIWQLSRINGVSTSMTLLWPATKSEHYVWRSDSSLTKRIHPVSIFKPAISDHPVINTVLEILFAKSTWWAIQYSFPIVILSVIDAKCSFLDPTLGQNFQECARLPAAERFVPCMSSPVSCQLVWTCEPSEESMMTMMTLMISPPVATRPRAAVGLLSSVCSHMRLQHPTIVMPKEMIWWCALCKHE